MHTVDTQTRCLSRYPTPAKVFNKERGSQSQDVHQAMMLLHDDHDGEPLGDVYHYQDCHGKPFPSWFGFWTSLLCVVFKYDGPLSWSPIWVANDHYLQANHVLNEWRDVTTLQSGDASHWNIYQIHETLILEIHDAPPHYKMVMIVTTTMMMFIGTLVADLVNSCHHLQTGGQLALLIRLHHIPTFLCSATRHAEQQAGRGHHKDLL